MGGMVVPLMFASTSRLRMPDGKSHPNHSSVPERAANRAPALPASPDVCARTSSVVVGVPDGSMRRSDVVVGVPASGLACDAVLVALMVSGVSLRLGMPIPRRMSGDSLIVLSCRGVVSVEAFQPP